ncbi:MATE family efflux transporter [Chitinophagaceae bacterium LB-8]|uniref:Multidrug-efflux transporter n=1 Tax=Paraflavisolibacter caeni TaxID=2982496 RepID=A0A9X2Y0R6_9BACT|nr:MATE family efflux transporter [Paraflavisolibacter caeni]MCU7552372.1 MATE family efflux transporter [Paraflavisolibacter caeni]
MSQQSISTNRASYIFSLIKTAIRGEEHDYTKGSLRMAVILLAIPMILEMMMESVFAVVDIFFVGKLGKEAISTVVLTETFLTLLYSAAIAFSVGATAMVARRVGEKNFDAAAKAGAQAINLGWMVAVVISIIGVVYARDVLQLMGASESVLAIGVSYTRVVFGSSVVILLLFLINGVFRGAGNASIAMKSLWVANGCNIVLCPLLIHFFGLTGAAIATSIGRGLGVCFQLYHLFKGNKTLSIRSVHFTIDWHIIKSLFQISWVGFVQFFIASASWIVLARIMSSFGNDAAIAGYGVAIRIIMFFLLPAWGMSNAAATLVGQNLGANDPERAERAVWLTARYNAIFMATVMVIFLVFAEMIVQFMNKDVQVEVYAVEALRIISLGYVFYGVGMVMANTFNGAGDTRTPTIINLFGFWAFQIPLAYLLAIVLDFGPTGVFIAIPVAETAITIAAFLTFRKGKWKKVKV